jgi:hypothetical protein
MSVNSATENIQDFSIRYPVILYNLFYGPSIVIPIEPIKPVKLTRTYTAQCPICNQRTDTTDSSMREVYCIN